LGAEQPMLLPQGMEAPLHPERGVVLCNVRFHHIHVFHVDISACHKNSSDSALTI
jgi:hypothetical protein